MFTVIFALSRTIGWIAHWNEMHADPDNRINWPMPGYTGLSSRDFQPLQEENNRSTILIIGMTIK